MKPKVFKQLITRAQVLQGGRHGEIGLGICSVLKTASMDVLGIYKGYTSDIHKLFAEEFMEGGWGFDDLPRTSENIGVRIDILELFKWHCLEHGLNKNLSILKEHQDV